MGSAAAGVRFSRSAIWSACFCSHEATVPQPQGEQDSWADR